MYYTLFRVNGEVEQVSNGKRPDREDIHKWLSTDDFEFASYGLKWGDKDMSVKLIWRDNTGMYDPPNENITNAMNSSKNKRNKQYVKFWGGFNIKGDVVVESHQRLI